MSRTLLLVLSALCAWAFPIAALAESLDDIPGKLLSQCGIASGLLVAAVVYLANSNAKTRSSWEADRTTMAASYEKLATSHAKLEGIVLALQSTRYGGGEG